MVNEALKAAEAKNAEIELITVSDMKISSCIACDCCMEKGRCIVEDDMQKVFNSMENAGGIIFGTPVYFVNVSAQAKTIMYRTYSYLISQKLKGKVDAVITAARRVGGGQVLSLMYHYFLIQGMNIAGGSIGYGLGKGEVLHGPGVSPMFSAMEEARIIGKKVAKLCSLKE